MFSLLHKSFLDMVSFTSKMLSNPSKVQALFDENKNSLESFIAEHDQFKSWVEHQVTRAEYMKRETDTLRESVHVQAYGAGKHSGVEMIPSASAREIGFEETINRLKKELQEKENTIELQRKLINYLERYPTEADSLKKKINELENERSSLMNNMKKDETVQNTTLTREHSIVAVQADVMLYEESNRKWVPSGSRGVSKVHIYHHPINNTYRVVGRQLGDQEVVINCAILKGLKYNQATPSFHQWRDIRNVYGLHFKSTEDAERFGKAMIETIGKLS